MAPYHGGGNLAESLSKSFGYNCDHDNDKNLRKGGHTVTFEKMAIIFISFLQL